MRKELGDYGEVHQMDVVVKILDKAYRNFSEASVWRVCVCVCEDDRELPVCGLREKRDVFLHS